MAWVRLDDGFPDHPKVAQAGPVAAWLYVCGLAYCNRYLTDGFIPESQVRRLADIDGATDLAARLVTVGLWEAVDGGYRVHDYLDFQHSREQIERTRTARAEAGSKGGKQKASNLLERGYQHVASKTLPQTQVTTQGVNTPLTAGSVADAAAPPPAPPPEKPIQPVPKPKERDKSWIERHPLFPALVAIPEIGRPAGDGWGLWGKALKTLDELGATPEEIPRRAENYPAVMGTKADGTPIPLTLTSLVKHWNLLSVNGRRAPPPTAPEAGAVAFARRHGLGGKP